MVRSLGRLRRLAEAEAMCALPEDFQSNSLALLQAVYRDP
jgi:hypothetical protein